MISCETRSRSVSVPRLVIVVCWSLVALACAQERRDTAQPEGRSEPSSIRGQAIIDEPRHGSPTDSMEGPAPAEDELQRLQNWAERLHEAQEVASFGRFESDTLGYVIGKVCDATTDSVGNVLILDCMSNDLRVFGPDGHYLHTVGRTGRGPGEFLEPRKMDWLSPDTLVVVDGTRRGLLFETEGGGSLRFLRTFPTRVGVEQICIHEGQLWVHGLGQDPDERIHLVDMDIGEIIGGFAPVPPEDNPILQRRRALGFMACSLERDLVALTSRYFPDIQVYDFSGNELWAGTVPNFTPMEFTLVDGGGVRQGIAREAGGFHWILGVLFLDSSTIAVQVGWQTAQSSKEGLDYGEVSTHLFSSDSGVSLAVEGSIPLIHERTPLGFLASVEDPYPRVLHFGIADLEQ